MQVKYWVYDGKDAQGPYDPEELKALPMFGPETMICPDGAQTADQWKPAKYYLIRPPTGGRPQEPALRSQFDDVPAIVDTPPPQKLAPAPEPLIPAPAPAAPSTQPEALGAGVIIEFNPPRPRPRPQPSRLPAILAAALVLGGAAAGAYWWRGRPKKKAPDPAGAASSADAEAARAVDFARGFPLQSPAEGLPERAGDVLAQARWSPAGTLGELYERRALFALAQDAAALLRKQGRSPAQGAQDIAKAGPRWDIYAQGFLGENFSQQWSAEPYGPNLFRVTAKLRFKKGTAEEHRRFEADLASKTLKPLDVEAWHDLAAGDCAEWSGKHLRLGEVLDETVVSPRAPAYTLAGAAARPSRGITTAPAPVLEPAPVPAAPARAAKAGSPARRTARAAPAAKPARPAKARPAPKPAARPAGDEDEYDEVVETSPGERAAPAMILGTDVSQIAPLRAPGDPAAPRPAAARPPAPAPAPAQPAAGKAKSVADMDVNELEKYLNRGTQGAPKEPAVTQPEAGGDPWD